MTNELRPWGNFYVLHEENNFKIKKITVKPKGRLSYQYHYERSELWYVISGVGIVTINDEVIKLNVGSTIKIEKKDRHRVENKGSEDLIFVEIQTGSYFGEDDIVRLDDDYNRK
tara:strand:+ start:5348 stop:5689 length:342 start_codon:yes stop_codon:yes gene_type:complete